MERPSLSGKSNYRVEAVLDVCKKDTRVFGDGTYSDAISNNATGTASIADENTYHVQADSESGEYVSAFARQFQGIITVSAQSGLQPPQPDDGAGTVKEEEVKKTPVKAHRQVRERMVTKIEPVQSLTSSSKPLLIKNKFEAIAAVDGKEVVDISHEEQQGRKIRDGKEKKWLTSSSKPTSAVDGKEVVDGKEQSRKTLDREVKKRWLREIEPANRLTSSSKPTSAVDGKKVDINDYEQRWKTRDGKVKQWVREMKAVQRLTSSSKINSTKNKFAAADEAIDQKQTIVQGESSVHEENDDDEDDTEENDDEEEEEDTNEHWCDIL